MRFAILGPVEVWAQERRLDLGGRRQLAVLAYLLLRANRAVSSDSLIDAVWETAGAGAEKRLQMAIARLRKELATAEGGERRLRTVGGGYLLPVESGELDADVFRAGVREGRAALDAGDPARASGLLGQALGLWRGPSLAEVSFVEFAQADIRQLEELRLEALESRADADLALGRHVQLVSELEALRVEHPARERLAGQLMLALYRCGRQSEALGVYQRLRTELLEQVGLEPGPELKALQAEILEQAPALDLGAGGNARRPTVPRMRAPEGTIALLFTDIEGSTRLAAELGGAWPAVLDEHPALVGEAIAEQGGFVQSSDGDAFFATFTDAQAAARAAVAAMRNLRAHPWPETPGELRVRMGLHVGYVQRTDAGYVGLELNRAARVADAAHGGQLLITAAAKELIGDQLDTEPLGAHRLKDFPAPELLFCAVIDGRGAAFFPPPRTQQIRATNLPAGMPPLVGRELELKRVGDAFVADRERIVTLTGRGGVGKTSLALTAAAGLLDEHPGGVWLIRLATVSSPEDVLPIVAGVVGAKASADESPLDAITARLSGRGPTLLVLDNLEHLLPAARSLSDLLERVPNVRVLVTSQAPLRLTDERCLTVDALDEDAALVLIERVARRRDSSFAIADDDRAVLGEIVSMLDGLPLALELAAARLGVLSAAQLRDRLHGSPDVLRDDVRDRTDRQRSLRATVEWTLESLDAPARELFVRMGAFAGPVELTELELVAGADGLDVLEALSSLRDVALVRRVETGDGRVTFGPPEAVRQIAAAMLDSTSEGERWRREHAQRQLDVQWAARGGCPPRPVYEAAVAADAEAAIALDWARATGDPRAAPLAAAYATVLEHTSRGLEALAIVEPLLDPPPADPEVHAQALIAKAGALAFIDMPADRVAAATAALELVTEDGSRVNALALRAVGYLMLGHVEAAIADSEQAITLARGLAPETLSYALTLAGTQARIQAGHLDLAAALLEEAQQTGADTSHRGSEHDLYADLAMARDEPQEAARQYALSLEHSQQRGHFQEQIRMDLHGLAEALAMNRDDIEALEVAGMAAAQTRDLGAPDRPVWQIHGREPLPEAEKRLGAEAAAQARQRGLEVDAGYRVTRACELAHSRHPTAR